MQLLESGLPLHFDSPDSLPPFKPLPQAIQDTNKTGLGSSAALVTSLTAGVLLHLGIISSDGPKGAFRSPGLSLVHNLSQYSHCLAQGKVGSGFDISSAVFGTHVYRRFSPAILAPLMDDTPKTAHFLLEQLESDMWDHSISHFTLPAGLRLVLADVDAGTDTPSFVSKVLAWRKDTPEESSRLWSKLGQANDTLADLLGALTGYAADKRYALTLRKCAERPIKDYRAIDPVEDTLSHIGEALDVSDSRSTTD